MDKNDLKRIISYLMITKTPILIDDKVIYEIMKSFSNYKLSAYCDDNILYGEYKTEYKAPHWYNYLENRKKEDECFLVIDLNNSTIEQQRRFISLAQDRTIQTLNLPDNCHLILVSSDTSKVDKELLGLTIRI